MIRIVFCVIIFCFQIFVTNIMVSNYLKYFSGFTLVVSPMVSLMEDQIIQMQKLNVNAQMISSYSTKEETKLLFQVPKLYFS